MAELTTITAKIDPVLKTEVESIFQDMNLSITVCRKSGSDKHLLYNKYF